MTALQKLIDHNKKVSNFTHLRSIAYWDQAAMMPAGGAQARASAMAELNVYIHSRL